MTERTVTFNKDKETKNTVRFQEIGPKESVIIGPLYIQKSFLGNPSPDVVTVTVKFGEFQKEIISENISPTQKK